MARIAAFLPARIVFAGGLWAEHLLGAVRQRTALVQFGANQSDSKAVGQRLVDRAPQRSLLEAEPQRAEDDRGEQAAEQECGLECSRERVLFGEGLRGGHGVYSSAQPSWGAVTGCTRSRFRTYPAATVSTA